MAPDQQPAGSADNQTVNPNPTPAAPEPQAAPAPQVISPTTPTPAAPQPAAPAPLASEAPFQSLAPTNAPITTATPVVNGTAITSAPMPVVPMGNPKKKPLLLAGIIGLAVILLGVGAVFGLYLPNTPSHVYSSGLNRSGKALNSIVNQVTNAKQLDQLKSSELSGTVSVTMDGKTTTGSFDSAYDKQNSNSSLSYTTSENQTLSANILTSIPASSKYPDIYFKLTGLHALGLDAFMPEVASYDGKWISVPSSYIESLANQYASNSGQSAPTPSRFTADDASSLAKIVANKTSEYLLTTDKQKNVIDLDHFVATEKFSGNVTADHYVVTIDRQHYIAFCSDLASSVIGSTAYKHLNGSSDSEITKAKEDATKSCQKTTADNVKGTFDLWINKKTKLIYKVRITDDKDTTTYVELGQNYTSGSALPVFAVFHSGKDKYDGRLDLTTDLQKTTATGKFTLTGGGDSKYTVNATLSFKPHTGPVTVTPPAGAIPLQQVLNALGFGSSSPDNSSFGNVSPSRSSLPNTQTKPATVPTNLFQNLHL